MKDLPTSSVDVSHHIQRSILVQLRQHGVQSYRDLKPDGFEGNAYNYHLNILKQAKLIEGSGQKYELTPVGYVVADAFSLAAQRLVLRPHMYTFLLAISDDHVLLYEPTRQPLPGVHCLPSGKMHYGDTCEQSVAREALRRNMTDEYTTEHIGSINLVYRRGGDVVLQRPGMIWKLDYTGERRESPTASGSGKWYRIDELSSLARLTPEVGAALGLLHDSKARLIEIDTSV